MKVFSISMIKNEADIIESFIRYHQSIFDGMVILDNGSTDNTLPIIQKLQAEGYAIYLYQDKNTEYNQDEKMSKLLSITFEKYEPDIVFPLDADEFLIASNNNINPKEYFLMMNLNTCYYLKWRTYIPTKTDNIKEISPIKRMNHVRPDMYEKFSKVVVPKHVFNQFLPKLTMGNHDINLNSRDIKKEEFGLLKIAHFPVRSIEQIKSKVLVGWINFLSKPSRKPGDGFQWEHIYRIIKEKKELSNEVITFLGLNYAMGKNLVTEDQLIKNPIDLSFSESINLKYTGYDEINVLNNLLENCELLAKQYASLKSEVDSLLEFE